MAKSLQQTVQNYVNSAPVAQANYLAGVQASTKPIVQAAIAAQQSMVANFNAAVQNGSWANRLQAVGDAGIKAAIVAKANNYSTGIQAGQGKYQTRMATWLPIIDQAAATVNAMPSGSLAASINRVTQMMTLLHNAKLAGN